MADLFEPDLGTASYRSRDPIKNLKISIKLKRITSTSILPQAGDAQKEGDNQQMELQGRGAGGPGDDQDEYTFKWQEKIYSQREVDKYSAEGLWATPLEQKYHQDGLLLKEVGRPTVRLFCYTDNDSFTNMDESVKKLTTSPTEEPTVLSQQMSNVRQRKMVQLKGPDTCIPSSNVVDYKPSEEARKHRHLVSTAVYSMYLMADLSPKGREATSEDEFVLCTVRVDSNGVISIRPDYNTRPYKVESGGMGRDIFEFTVSHASKQLTRQEQMKETKMFKELYSRHSEYLQACVGHDFEVPAYDVLRFLVYGEIESAKNFEYDDLYIHYFVELPEGWQPANVHQLSGVTHTCSTKVVGKEEIAFFSFPFDFEVFYKRSVMDRDYKEEVMPQWPVLYFEVLSLDSWQRHRTEGYGYTLLPCTPGSHVQEVHCWRPAGRSRAAELRRFFVGGTPELEDPTYAATPSTFQGERLSKFGFRTISTGSVTVRLNCLQQSQAFLQSKASKKKVGTLIDRLGTSRAQVSILNVLEAFQRAKQKMIAARENLKRDFVETLQTYVQDGEDYDED